MKRNLKQPDFESSQPSGQMKGGAVVVVVGGSVGKAVVGTVVVVVVVVVVGGGASVGASIPVSLRIQSR